MNTKSRLIASLAILALCGLTAPTQAKPFDDAVAKLRAAFDSTQHMPLDPDLYAPNLHVSHNYEPGRIVDVPEFLKGASRELAAAKKVGASDKSEVTRFLVGGDTVVVTVLNSGKLADGSPTRFYLAYFFKIADGKIVDLETWYDRKGAEEQTKAIKEEMTAK